jgi:pimeloyl-ACP methyl ester carboxylesterase
VNSWKRTLAIFAAAFLLLVADGSRGVAVAQAVASPPAVTRLASATDRQVVVNGASLRYRHAGEGEAVVLLHGYGGQLEDLAPIADRLLSTNSVVAIDLRGFGKSAKSSDAANYGVRMADDVIGVLDALKIPKAHIVGHSMGALIAASAVARYSPRFHTATLIAGPFYPDAASARRDLAPWLADLEGGRGMSAFVRWLFPAVPQAAADGMSAGMLQANDQPSLIAVMRSMPVLAESAVRVSAVPAVVVVGSNDPLVPNNRAFVGRSSGVKLIEVSGADHVSVGGSRETMAAMLELIRSKALR